MSLRTQIQELSPDDWARVTKAAAKRSVRAAERLGRTVDKSIEDIANSTIGDLAKRRRQELEDPTEPAGGATESGATESGATEKGRSAAGRRVKILTSRPGWSSSSIQDYYGVPVLLPVPLKEDPGAGVMSLDWSRLLSPVDPEGDQSEAASENR
ncbi:hypothetical protein [Gordonia sp. SMJS1]|uniref:hypothetical protein n=1 Tax=Gordonia sp. SMJS1 TaxID=3039400 RepID=UPI00245902CA|nr:hypothetical protein [Gordonia sp. SMJS1]WGJ88034.1 hypothetical protein QAD21_24295 [Gordonia sp. SMJS1]